MMMYDLEKASKSAAGISLYVSSDRKVATKYQDQAAPEFPDQDGALVYELKAQASSSEPQAASLTSRKLYGIG